MRKNSIMHIGLCTHCSLYCILLIGQTDVIQSETENSKGGGGGGGECCQIRADSTVLDDGRHKVRGHLGQYRVWELASV